MSDTREATVSSGLQIIFRNGGLLFTARLTSQVSRLAYVLLVVRTLGPERYGTLVYLSAWGLMFLPLANMGSQSLLSRAFGYSSESGRQLAQRLWTLRVLVLPLLAAILIGIGMSGEPDPDIRPLFIPVGIALVGRGFALWGNHVLVGNHHADRVLLLEVVFRVGEVVTAALALQAGTGILGLLCIHALFWWLQAFASVLWVGATVVHPAWRWQDLDGFQLLRQSLATMAIGLTMFSLMQGPVLLGRYMLGTGAELGQLALAMQLLQVMAAIPNTLGIAALPTLAATQDRKFGRRYLAIVVPVSVVVALALAGLTFVAGEPVLGLLFGERFIASAPLLSFAILVLLVPVAPAVLLSHAALASRRPGTLRRTATAALCGLCTGIILIAVAQSHWGITGILLSAGGGAFVWLALIARINLYHLPLRP
jgi:O-antigen/teichoic acid export membrane protein